MEHLKDQVAQLVAEATASYATVQRSGDFLHLTPHDGPRLSFKMELWREDATPTAVPNPLWILRKPSKRTLDRLRDEGASFAAMNGTVRVIGSGLVIDRTGVATRSPRKAPQHRSAFSDRASLVARWLFRSSPDDEWPVTVLAERSGVSLSVASYAVTDLEDRRLLTTERRGRERWVRGIDHVRLVQEWTSEYNWRKNYAIRASAPIGSPLRFLGRLDSERLPRWAAAFHTGAQFYASHTPAPHVQIYVDLPKSALAGLVTELGWTARSDGGIQLFVPYHRRSVWHWIEHVEGIPVVSPLQLILDLWNHPIRGREQADLLLEKQLLALGHD